MRRVAPIVLLLSGISCGITQLTPTSEVVRTRVAGIRADPAEIAPGGATTLEALLVRPRGNIDPMGAFWVACVSAGNAAGCLGLDAGTLLGGDDDSADSLPTDLQFGVGDRFTYRAEGPTFDAAWAALPEEDRVEGLSVFVSVTYVPRSNEELQTLLVSLGTAVATGDQATAARLQAEMTELFDLGLSSARRVIVSDKTQGVAAAIECPVDTMLPNRNPFLAGVLVHVDEKGRDGGLPLGVLAFAAPEQELVLRPVLAEGSIEDYLYVTTDGVTQCRVESPWFAWLSNGGEWAGDYSFMAEEGDLEEVEGRPKLNTLTLPVADEFDEAVTVWLVMRDRRGGLDWRQVDIAPKRP